MTLLGHVCPSVAAMSPNELESILRLGLPSDAPVRHLKRSTAAFALQERHDLSLLHDAPNGDAVVVLGYVGCPGSTKVDDELAQVLLSSWREKGVAFLSDLEGSFALILYDAAQSRLLVAVDCLSSRSIWYAKTADGLAIGTNVQAVCEMLSERPTLDKAYLWSFLVHRCTVDNRSPFEQIRALDAGEAIEFQSAELRWHGRYTDPVFHPQQRPVNDTAAELADALQSTVAEACRSSRSPCLLLSGGLDSRLVAGTCPPDVASLTLSDSLNHETAFASRTACACALAHRIIIRDKDWYPSILEAGSLTGNGIWAWNEAHYLPLARPQWDYHHDVTLLGFGSNTYFKGNHLTWPRVWDPPPVNSFDDYFLQLVMETPEPSADAVSLLKAGARQECEQAYRQVAREVIARVSSWADSVPDMWELFWSHSLTRVVQALNLASLREFSSDRSAFGGRRIQKLYLSVPPQQRAQGAIIRKALRHVGKGLTMIPDANTWLPAGLPLWMHAFSRHARRRIAQVRHFILNRSKSRNYISRCSWPHFGLLWFASETMRNTMDKLVADESAFPDAFFDRDAIRQVWEMHRSGQRSLGSTLDVLVTFGIFHRNTMKR